MIARITLADDETPHAIAVIAQTQEEREGLMTDIAKLIEDYYVKKGTNHHGLRKLPKDAEDQSAGNSGDDGEGYGFIRSYDS